MFAGDVWVRLMVEYTTDDPVCVSQQSFQSAANSNANGIIVLPVGKTASFYRMFGAELAPGFTWQLCGATSNPSAITQNCDTPGGPIGGLTFILTLDKDEADNAVRVHDKCEDTRAAHYDVDVESQSNTLRSHLRIKP